MLKYKKCVKIFIKIFLYVLFLKANKISKYLIMSNFLVETKQEYTTQLINVLTPLIYEGIQSIYNEVIKISSCIGGTGGGEFGKVGGGGAGGVLH